MTDQPTPQTEAGRDLWDHFAPAPLPDAQELHRRSAQGRRDKLLVGILAIEAQARTEALDVDALHDILIMVFGECRHDRGVPDCRVIQVAILAAKADR